MLAEYGHTSGMSADDLEDEHTQGHLILSYIGRQRWLATETANAVWSALDTSETTDRPVPGNAKKKEEGGEVLTHSEVISLAGGFID